MVFQGVPESYQRASETAIDLGKVWGWSGEFAQIVRDCSVRRDTYFRVGRAV